MAISTRTILEKKGSLKQGVLQAASIKRRNKQSYSLRQILVGPFAIEMQLTSFICHKTEDFIGRDDLSLDIFVDDEYETTLQFQMNSGAFTKLSNSNKIQANRKISFQLYEHDRYDPDDLLGERMFSNAELVEDQIGKLSFNNFGANYSLHFEVKALRQYPMNDSETVEEFRARTTKGAWSNFNRNEVADQLLERIKSPEKIQQGINNAYGPTTVLFELARFMPRRYVKMIIDLYEDGIWMSNKGSVRCTKISEKERDYFRSKNKMPIADYIAWSSMTSSPRVPFAPEFKDEEHSFWKAGIMANEIILWCNLLLGWRQTDIYTTTQFGRLGFKIPVLAVTEALFGLISGSAVDGLKKSKNVLRYRGIAILQFNSGLLEYIVGRRRTSKDKNLVDHIVPTAPSFCMSLYDNTANISSIGRVSINIYTSGKVEKVEIPEKLFETEMFSFIFVKPGGKI